MVGKSKTHFRVQNVLYLESDKKLKSDGEITIRFPIVDWVGNEMATEVHCDA